MKSKDMDQMTDTKISDMNRLELVCLVLELKLRINYVATELKDMCINEHSVEDRVGCRVCNLSYEVCDVRY
jgi:hypothetical protein